jgi:hypothetical protein
MDAGNGNFKTAPTVKKLFEQNPDLRDAYARGQHVFKVGQELDIAGSTFKIRALGKKFMRLELRPRKEIQE